MSEQKTTNTEKEAALESIITAAVQIPGVKVDRNKFLASMFAHEDVDIKDVLEYGPIAANISQEHPDFLSVVL